METKDEFELGVLTPTPISVIHLNCRWFLLVGTLTNLNTCWDTDNILVTVIIGYRGADFEGDEKPKGDPWKSKFFC